MEVEAYRRDLVAIFAKPESPEIRRVGPGSKTEMVSAAGHAHVYLARRSADGKIVSSCAEDLDSAMRFLTDAPTPLEER